MDVSRSCFSDWQVDLDAADEVEAQAALATELASHGPDAAPATEDGV